MRQAAEWVAQGRVTDRAASFFDGDLEVSDCPPAIDLGRS